ncbi:MAG: twin-arginine translocase TatA/TatE family subunit [Syntrophomonas sp.]|nr:twin-arginine translocase TatA/TatE family subunit [Syntrophomonas sp.]
MFNIGPWEMGLILLVALIVVGPGKLPEVAKSIGKGINEFKKVTNGYKKELQDAMDDIETPIKESKSKDNEKKANSVADMANNFDSIIKEDKGVSAVEENPTPPKDK